MSDDLEPTGTSSDSHVTSSYGTCPGCGLYIHHAQDQCPECGALAHETGTTHPRHPGTPFFTLVVAGIVAVCLYMLSRDKQEFAAAELARFRRLTGEQVQRPRPRPPAQPPVAPPSGGIPDPEPAPVPPPATPAPLPFAPETAEVPPAPEPEPDPEPVPDPEPEPEPELEPEPEPEPAPLTTLELRDQLAEEYTRDLDERFPMAEIGAVVELTLSDNRTIRGRIRRFDSQEVILETAIGLRGVPYRQLSRESRMRVDRGERNTWAQERAVQEVLNRRSP